ncbi:MAG: type II toxin-antitoxin system RelE/ParE family toxin [Alphaproteobacteria bacterium CG_4_10_14_0_2_um_filter_63_37]|nr:MAG: plasmid stabilization protein [Proteobacteria bacterium CG1_02_64_396]PJA25820.1 MAG: type II toxin-antitoxin system RelE/ParE family toxin [Alphaproteobacteria bacterium CG_4_10_14_0_2_um_filter_63_37]
MKVHWTRSAESHLDAIHRYIAQDSPVYAQRMVDRITRRSMQIAAFPRSGRIVPEYGHDAIREVFESSYRIIYRIYSDRIDVLAVLHGAQARLNSQF